MPRWRVADGNARGPLVAATGGTLVAESNTPVAQQQATCGKPYWHVTQCQIGGLCVGFVGSINPVKLYHTKIRNNLQNYPVSHCLMADVFY